MHRLPCFLVFTDHASRSGRIRVDQVVFFVVVHVVAVVAWRVVCGLVALVGASAAGSRSAAVARSLRTHAGQVAAGRRTHRDRAGRAGARRSRDGAGRGERSAAPLPAVAADVGAWAYGPS
jgi:hypothetical protein